MASGGNVLSGDWRKPVQMLADQSYGGHKSLHDDAEAERLGIKAGPIEGPTHFSQFDPLLREIWGDAWFEYGCFSSHFKNMVFEGEAVRAFVERPAKGALTTKCWAEKEDGTPVLEASASIGPNFSETLLEARMQKLRTAESFVILSDMHVGMTGAQDELVTMTPDQHMGDLYPFTLAEKLNVITEPIEYYAANDTPWGGAIIPFEMVSVIGNYSNRTAKFPVKQPSIGLFADLEIRMVNGPLLVGKTYRLTREIVALSQSRRVENYWIRTQFFDASSGHLKAEMLLNHGVLKASYPTYPADLLPS